LKFKSKENTLSLTTGFTLIQLILLVLFNMLLLPFFALQLPRKVAVDTVVFCIRA
jgi:hypothetical protein